MMQNGTHPVPSNLPVTPQKRPPPAVQTTPTRLTASVPYNIPNRPRPVTWPAKQHIPPEVIKQPLPVQRGRDAVLFAAMGNDPMDVMGRMDT